MNARYYPCRGVKQGRSAGEVVSISSPRCAGDAMNIHFRVELSEAERNELTAMLSGGRQAARKLKRAQILLAADAGSSDEAIAGCVGVGPSTVYRTKRRFVEGNQPAGRLAGGAAARRRAQAVGQGGGLAGGDRLRQPARGAGPLDAGAAGRCDGPADRPRRAVAGDGAPAPGREPACILSLPPGSLPAR